MAWFTEQPHALARAYGDEARPRKAFFTDTSICIGCKACEVACKEWNNVPRHEHLQLLGSSYDNTGGLGANTWRHVAFIEQDSERIRAARESGRNLVHLGMPAVGPPPSSAASGGQPSVFDAAAQHSVDTTPPDTDEFRWLMSSDVCKHCTHAGCLDVCPTGALFRTEFDTVVVQDDICNGCGTCVAGCPFGVIERREDGTVNTKSERADSRYAQEIPNAGTANKCTLCYDRLVDDQTPACAQACPTESIRFGDRTEMVERAHHRVQELHAQGRTEARLYGANDNDGVGGTGAVFLLLDEPEVYGLPPDPQVPTANLAQMYKTAVLAAAGMAAAAVGAFLGGRT